MKNIEVIDGREVDMSKYTGKVKITVEVTKLDGTVEVTNSVGDSYVGLVATDGETSCGLNVTQVGVFGADTISALVRGCKDVTVDLLDRGAEVYGPTFPISVLAGMVEEDRDESSK